MTDLHWAKKAGIGALGGLALGLLKLIEAKFFLSGLSSVEAYAGYLTYTSYMLLGSVAAVFLADHELPAEKLKRSAFILGLLAPSVLLAIANQPLKQSEPGTNQQPPTLSLLGWIPLPGAIAQDKADSKATGAVPGSQVKMLSQSSLQPSFGDAVAAAVGRKNLDEPYAYVIGTTTDEKKALDTAQKIRRVLGQGAERSMNLDLRVVQVEGKSGYYVLVGDLGSREDLSRLRTVATSAAIGSIGADRSDSAALQAERKAIAQLLVNGPILPARSLSSGP